MENNSGSVSKGKKKHPKILLTITTIYGILYVALIFSYLIFENSKSEITLEGIIVSFAFIFFLIGYYYSWKNQLIAGIIFILWWGIMWYLTLFVVDTDKGVGVVMGIPLFVIGILFLVNWKRTMARTDNN